MPVDGGRGENSTRKSCTCDGLGGVTLCEDCASPAAAPDVTALAQTIRRYIEQTPSERTRTPRWEPLDALAALLAEVERLRQERDEERDAAEAELEQLWKDREAAEAREHKLREALTEINKRERRSEYSSIYAAPAEFAAIARDALAAVDRSPA